MQTGRAGVFSKRLCVVVNILSALLATAPAFCAEPAQSDATAKIAPEKLALIKELLVEARTTQNARMGFDLVFDQQMKGMTTGASARIDQNPMLTNAQREEAKKRISTTVAERSKRLKELFEQKMNMDQAVMEVYTPLYDRHFSTEEIQQLLAFYKSPAGKKSLDELPKMSLEAATLLNFKLMPVMREIVMQMEQEDRQRIEEALPKSTPDKP
jgi:uncharacterized protein